MKPKAKSPVVLAENLRRLMEQTEGLRTQVQVAKAANIGQTSVSLMLRPEDRRPSSRGKTPSPSLADVESVAAAFGLEVWQILIDKDTLGEIFASALSKKTTPDARLHQRGVRVPVKI